MSDGPRSFLTGPDREYLRGGREGAGIGEGAEYNTKRRIRRRTRRAIMDFTLLFDELEYEELKKIFGGSVPFSSPFDDPEFNSGVRDTLAFVLLGSGAARTWLRPDMDEEHATAGRLLEKALERIAWRTGYQLTSLELSVEAERVPIKEYRNRLESGEELSEEELGRFIQLADGIDTAELNDSVRNMISEAESE